MRRYYLLLLAVGACTLSSCAIMDGLFGAQAVKKAGEAGIGAAGKFLSGDTAGAVGQSIDMVLILLGLKAAQKTGQKAAKVVKAKVLNPSVVVPSEPETTQAA